VSSHLSEFLFGKIVFLCEIHGSDPKGLFNFNFKFKGTAKEEEKERKPRMSEILLGCTRNSLLAEEDKRKKKKNFH